MQDVGTDVTTLNDFATRYTAAWCSQDPASVANFFTVEGSLTVNDGDPAIGREEITEVARGFMSAFPDMEVIFDGLDLEDEHVRYNWTLVGTNTGPDGTGNAVRISGYEQWTMGDDGLIARSLGNFDASDYQRQLEHGVEGE